MRIWVCNPFDLLPGEGARLQRYGLLCKALAQAGHRVVWWTSDFCHLTKKLRTSAPNTLPGVEVRLVQTRPYRCNISLARIWSHRCYAHTWRRLAEVTTESPDLIIASLPPLSGCEAVISYAKSHNCPVVVDVMDAWPETFEQLVPRLFLKPFFRQAQRIFDGATAVSGVGQSYLDLALKKRSNLATHLCYHGIELPLPPPQIIPTSTLRLCYIGNLGDRYYLEPMVDAVRLARSEGLPVELAIAGDGPKRPWLESVCGDGVRYYGLLGENQLHTLLRESIIGVIPMKASTWVAVPYKLADYCAMGLAVANGLQGECERLVSESKCGAQYDLQSPQSLLKLLRRWHASPQELADARTAALRLAQERFDANRIYPRYVAWLESVAKRN